MFTLCLCLLYLRIEFLVDFQAILIVLQLLKSDFPKAKRNLVR